MKKILSILFFLPVFVNGTNYYFKNGGSDANTGLSDAQAWQTVTKFNSFFASLSPGDSVLFKRGETFTGAFVISRSGTSGSPIIIGAYGSGAKPIFSGFTTVSAWTSLGGGIYESTSAVTSATYVNLVTFQDTMQPMGRWPKLDAANKGYLAYQTHSGHTTITSNAIASAASFVGGEVVYRAYDWILDRGRISAQTSTVITYAKIKLPSYSFDYEPANNYGLFFQNHVNACTVLGEWAYDSTTKKIKMYFGGASPSSYTIKAATTDVMFNIGTNTYIRFHNIKVTGANNNAFLMGNTNNIQWHSVDIDFVGNAGIETTSFSSTTFLVSNCTIKNCLNNGIFGNYTSNWTLQSNTISDCGLIRGMALSGAAAYEGVALVDAGSLVEYNVFKRLGYNGIDYRGDDVTIRYNFFDSICMILQDGGGIYTYGSSGETNRLIHNNIVLHSIGDYAGKPAGSGPNAHGIYSDAGATDITIRDNTVAFSNFAGLHMNWPRRCTITGNTFYDNGEGDTNNGAAFYFNQEGTIDNLVIKHNIAFARRSPQLIWVIYNTSAFPSWGVIDSNFYCRPIFEPQGIEVTGFSSGVPFNDGGIIYKEGPGSDFFRSLDTWKTHVSPEDAATVKTPMAITHVDSLRFEYNATNSAVVIDLDGLNYMDARGVEYDGEITLQPYTSAVLIQNGAASAQAQTKYYISNTGSDAAAGTLAAPWQTISKVNSSTFAAGDTIFFERGDVWREQLTLPSSGAVNNRIVFTAYGTGAKPIINGADIETGWTSAGSNQWWRDNPNAVTTRAMVIIDNVIYAEVASLAAVNSANEYFIDVAATPDRIYVYSTDDPDLHTVEVSNREYCIVTAAGASSKKYIEISDIEVRYAGRAGIYFEGPGSSGGDALNGASYVRRVKAYANRLFGIAHYDHYDSLVVEDCRAEYNGNGFYSWVADEGTFRRDTSSNQIYYTVGSSSSDGHGFGGYQSDNWLVENCYSNLDHDAIRLDAGGVATDAIIRYNKVFNSMTGTPPTPGMGTGSLGAGATIQIYYNLLVNCAGAGFTSYSLHNGTVQFYNNTIFLANGYGTEEGTMYLLYGTNFVLKNNIFARMGADSKTVLSVINPSLPTSDYNQWYQGPASAYRWHYNGSNYSTLALWRTGSSQDANSQSGDPLFVNQASDWSLQSGSPAINAGVSVGLTQDINGNPIVGLPDIGAFEYAINVIAVPGRKAIVQ